MGLGGILIDDERIETAFTGAKFGPGLETAEEKRRFLAKAVLKKVCDYQCGFTISAMMVGLGLTRSLHGKPTKAARRWMYNVLGRGI